MPTVQKQADVKWADMGIYADIIFDPSDAQPNYIGLNMLVGASTSGNDWKIYKITPSGKDCDIQVLYGSFNDRNTL